MHRHRHIRPTPALAANAKSSVTWLLKLHITRQKHAVLSLGMKWMTGWMQKESSLLIRRLCNEYPAQNDAAHQ